MIASLPMYERPQTAEAHDRFWGLIRDALDKDAPATLTRGGDPLAQWQAPDLLLSQTCGLPFRTVLKDRVTLVGTPDYGVGGCPPGHYCSVVLTRRGDDRPLETMRLAANDGLSQSGWAAASAYAEARGTPFGGVLKTGSHAASAHAVADGAADIAFVDAVTWSILTRWEPALEALCVIDRTPPMPGLPYITARAEEAPRLAQALRTAIAGLSPGDRALLRLRGLVEIPAADYLAIANPPPLPAETPAML